MLSISGMGRDLPAGRDPFSERILAVLSRTERIDALRPLIEALRADTSARGLVGSAVVLDANAVLRIPSHPRSTDVIDYLNTHSGPVILPGQVIQEFWNNQLAAVDTVPKSLEKPLDLLEKALEKLEEVNTQGVSRIRASIQSFKDENNALFHPETVRRATLFLEILAQKAIVPFAPRSRFSKIADERKRAKTPPGFRDAGDGDFLVWCDTLFGLSELKSDNRAFSKVIFVSNDAKIDWCREGAAHPILVAEVRALFGVGFEIWTLDKLVRAIDTPA